MVHNFSFHSNQPSSVCRVRADNLGHICTGIRSRPKNTLDYCHILDLLVCCDSTTRAVPVVSMSVN